MKTFVAILIFPALTALNYLYLNLAWGLEIKSMSAFVALSIASWFLVLVSNALKD